MAYNFLAGDRDQAFLLPPDVRDWLPADQPAWFVLDVVDQLDLGPFLKAYRADGHGRAAYEPRMLLAGLLVQSLRLCAAAGMVHVALVCLDGTKIQANAAAWVRGQRPGLTSGRDGAMGPQPHGDRQHHRP